MTTPALSSVARTVFVTAQDENARIRVSVTEVTAPGGGVVANGLTGTVVLNPDPQNPCCRIRAPEPGAAEPGAAEHSQGESYNPGITAALVGVPNLQNPSAAEPEPPEPEPAEPVDSESVPAEPRCRTPRCRTMRRGRQPEHRQRRSPNPSLQNPVLQNPNLQNPTLQNPNLQNAGFSDTNWVVTNEGNTTASYTVNLLLNDPRPRASRRSC